ncbi:MAG: hypothetical protein V7750_16020 [Sneathiella sp.]
MANKQSTYLTRTMKAIALQKSREYARVIRLSNQLTQKPLAIGKGLYVFTQDINEMS